MKKVVCVIVFSFYIFSTAAPLFSFDTERAINVGVCRFGFYGPEDDFMSSGISNRIFEMVSEISGRRINNQEIRELLREEKREELVGEKLKLEKLLEERDALIFTAETVDDFNTKTILKNERINKKKEEILEISVELEAIGKDLRYDDYTVLPINIKTPEEGKFFTLPSGVPSDIADELKLDLMIYGRIERIEDYHLIQIKIWNNIIGKEIGEWESAVKYDDIKSEMEPVFDDIKTAVLGREWAGLVINSADNGMIYIDGVFVGMGRVRNFELEPGMHSVRIKRPGFETVEEDVAIAEGVIKTVEIGLEAEPLNDIIIQTFPQEADLYIDSVWAGKTPVKVQIEDFPAAIRLSRDGWEDKEFFIERFTDDVVNVNLKPEIIDRKALVDGKRNRFYGSMGAFILSIPLTAAFYGGIEQSASAFKREDDSEAPDYNELKRLLELNKGCYAAYLGSIGLNIILFFDTILQAVEYVDSVDYVSE